MFPPRQAGMLPPQRSLICRLLHRTGAVPFLPGGAAVAAVTNRERFVLRARKLPR